jgi:1-acyl-sn-glycerol-3-phosphate acyltransferase
MKPLFSSRFFYWAHTLVIYFWVLFATTVLGSVVVFISIFIKKANLSHIVARMWGRTILWVSGIRVTMKGLEKLTPTQSYIYMANHQSNFDIPVLLGKLPVQFRWLAKAELFRIPIFGHAMRGCEYISIDRSNRKMAFKSLTTAARIIRNGTSVVIFPEGTRSTDGNLKEFKKGGFVLSVDAGVPIVPVIIRGTWSIMPKARCRIEPAPVMIEICDPIDTEGFTRKTKDDLITMVKNAMIAQLDPMQTGEKVC